MQITIIGTYLHANPIFIGGTEIRQGITKELRVSEAEFIRLVGGVQSGWFELKAHNYAKFLEAENRPVHYDLNVALLEKIGLPIFETIVVEPIEQIVSGPATVNEIVIETTVEEVAPAAEELAVIEETPIEETEKPKRTRKAKTTENTEE